MFEIEVGHLRNPFSYGECVAFLVYFGIRCHWSGPCATTIIVNKREVTSLSYTDVARDMQNHVPHGADGPDEAGPVLTLWRSSDGNL